MTKSFLQYVTGNSVAWIIPLDLDNTEFTTCDATGEYSDCIPCTVVDAAGAEWTADLNSHDVCTFINCDD